MLGLMLVLSSFSQKNNDRMQLSVTTGLSLPIGNFGNDDMTDEKAGVAKLGQAGSISYTQLIGKKIGFAVTLQGQRNPFNSKSAEKNFQR